MKLGYIRVSTKGQTKGTSIEDQRDKLAKEGCTKFYIDTYTGSTVERPELKRLLEEIQPGDTLAVTKMDRIARTETEAYNLVMGLLQKDIKVHILNLGLVEDTPTGRLIAHIMLAFAEFERDLIRERMQGGRAYKRATDPNYHEGRPKKYSRRQLDHAIDLLSDHSFSEVAGMTGISRATVVREARARGLRKSLA